jgi:hypothetical protein
MSRRRCHSARNQNQMHRHLPYLLVLLCCHDVAHSWVILPPITRHSPSITIRPSYSRHTDWDVVLGSENASFVDASYTAAIANSHNNNNMDDLDDDDTERAWHVEQAQRQATIQSYLQASDQALYQARKQHVWGAFANVSSVEDLTPLLETSRAAVQAQQAVQAEWAARSGIALTLFEPNGDASLLSSSSSSSSSSSTGGGGYMWW